MDAYYFGAMPTRRTPAVKAPCLRPALLVQLQIAVRKPRARKAEQVAFQWHDGAGELHYEVFSPEQSQPFLDKK